jgi:endoglucanase
MGGEKNMRNKLSLFLVFLLLLMFILPYAGGCLKEEEQPSGNNEFLTAYDKTLYFDDKPVQLIGTNAGGWLVTENWMCPLDDCDGKMPDQKTLLNILSQRFGTDGCQELLDIYMDHWWQESDFNRVQALGFNVIRLPFSYLNLLNQDLFWREDAFERLDWFIDSCAEREIFVILDLHGAPGSQNGQQHSVDSSQSALFSEEQNMALTEEIWVTVASRYKDNRWVAGYDLLNEPEGGYQEGKTTSMQWDFYDRLYRAIREVDEHHAIFMNSCWLTFNLPDPDRYGWENVVYEYHNYCWPWRNNRVVNWFFVNGIMLFDKLTNHPVPTIIGEFTFFDRRENWEYGLRKYTDRGWSWTTWTYKVTNNANAWGLYNQAHTETVNAFKDSYEEIAEKWSKLATDNFATTSTYDVVKDFVAGMK